MPVTFHIPGVLRAYTDGRSKVEIAGSPATVRDALQALWALYPGVRDRVASEEGQIRQHINVFVGNEDIRYTGGVATSLQDGAVISILPAISGGKHLYARNRLLMRAAL
ncbi:MAG: thiamine S protein [Bryobacterales bacterium]|nr:thiamine S protein [Bryobacterales bacterium]